MKIINRIKHLFARLRQPLRVRLDPADTSVTLSLGLVRQLLRQPQSPDGTAKAIVTRTRGGEYAITFNPAGLEETALQYMLQCNVTLGTTGFQCSAPTVSAMLYDYGLPPLIPAELPVKPLRAGGQTHYIIRRPKPKRQCLR